MVKEANCFLVLVVIFGSVSCSHVPPHRSQSDEQQRVDHRVFEFRTPFTDIEFANTKNVTFVKITSGPSLLMLHGWDLYGTQMMGSKRQLRLLCPLEVDDMEVRLVETIATHYKQSVILVVAFPTRVEVFHIAGSSIPTAIGKKPVQRILLNSAGMYSKAVFVQFNDVLYLVIAINTDSHGQFTVYKWSETNFHWLADELNSFPIDDLIVFNDVAQLIATRYEKSTHASNVRVVKLTSSSLESMQQLVLPSTVRVHPFTFKSRNYLLACDDIVCRLLIQRMSGQFRYTAGSRRPFHARVTAGAGLIIGERSANSIFVYDTVDMTCLGSFKSNESDDWRLASLSIHQAKANATREILLGYVKTDRVLVRAVEVMNSANKTTKAKNTFEEAVSRLQIALRKRAHVLDQIKKDVPRGTSPILVGGASRVGNVKIVSEDLRSPTQLLATIRELHSKLEAFKAELHQTLNDDGTILKAKRIRVKNLVYNGTLFNGLELNSSTSTLRVKIPVDVGQLSTARSFRSGTHQNVTTRALYVLQINGHDWLKFYEDIFIRGRDKRLVGNLTLNAQSTVDSQLETPRVNGVPVARAFDLITPQNITSNLIISQFFITRMDVDSFNGLDFAYDIARIGQNNFIESPVAFERLIVADNLTLAASNPARHIRFGFGDFQQFYTGRVTINGSLTVAADVKLATNTTVLRVNNRQVQWQHLSDVYWMKSVDQIFVEPLLFDDEVHFVDELHSKSLNGCPLSGYLSTQSGGKVLLVADSVRVTGSVFTDLESFPSKLSRVASNAVQRGEVADIFGQKRFVDAVQINKLIVANTLNGVRSSSFVSTNRGVVQFSGTKTFTELKCAHEMSVEGDLHVGAINGERLILDLLRLQLDRVHLNQSIDFENLTVAFLNGHEMSRIFDYVDLATEEDVVVLHKDVFVEGVASFSGNLQVDQINGLQWKAYRSALIGWNQNVTISGRKQFAAGLVVRTALEMPSINGHRLKELFANSLSKSAEQNIVGYWTFGWAKFSNLNVSMIQGIPATTLIDLERTDPVRIRGSLHVDNLRVAGNVQSRRFPLDFYDIHKRLTTRDTRRDWHKLRVLEHAEMPDTQLIDVLQSEAVRKSLRPNESQTITGRVQFSKPLISSMTTPSSKSSIFTNVDLEDIAKDCLFKRSSVVQVIPAAKAFHRPVQIQEVHALRRLATRNVNQVDIQAFNASIYRRNEEVKITGRKRFVGDVRVHVLSGAELVNSVPVDELVCAASTGRPMPALHLQRLAVFDDLHLDDVNRLDLRYFLRNRVRKHGAAQELFGTLTFDALTVAEIASIQSINGLSLDRLVQRTGSTQQVRGTKTIAGDLIIDGPTAVTALNGHDLIEKFRKSIDLGGNYSFRRLIVDRLTLNSGLEAANSSFVMYRQWLGEMQRQMQHVAQDIQTSIGSIEPPAPKIRYFEYDQSAVIEWTTSQLSPTVHVALDEFHMNRCERDVIVVQQSNSSNRIHLHRDKTNKIEHNSPRFNVTAENRCDDASPAKGILRAWWISLNSFEEKQFEFNGVLASLDIFNVSSSVWYVLVEVIEESGDDSLTSSRSMHLFQFDQLHAVARRTQQIRILGSSAKRCRKFLIVFGGTNIEIFQFSNEAAQFEGMQTIRTPTEVHSVEMTNGPDFDLLVLAAPAEILVYQLERGKFRLFQQSTLDTGRGYLVSFELATSRYFAVSGSSGDFHIYTLGAAASGGPKWHKFNSGHLPGLQRLVPLRMQGHQFCDSLLVLAAERSAILRPIYGF